MAKRGRVDTGGRRETLRVIGAVGVTCAFPFSADELYGQHAGQHGAERKPTPQPAPQPAQPYEPKFFSPSEFAVVSRIAGLIIPATGTPGAVEAGVPEYIDRVVSGNARSQRIHRQGIAWLDDQARRQYRRTFVQLSEEQQTALLEPLSEAVDAGRIRGRGESFFREIKNMTADGYYTSETGLVTELGYTGNTVLARFPESTLPEQ